MRNMFAIIMLISLLNCSNETELEKSIFIPDSDFPELPKYSEWGYNTFGAYYSRQVFISNVIEVPVKVIYHDSKTSLVFSGQLGSDYYASENHFSITLILSDFHPSAYDDLESLHGKVIDLTDPANEIIIKDASSDYPAEILNGQFKINRAQHLLVDNQSEEVILSGTFEFQAIVNGEPVSISRGRFDVGIGSNNFFKY